MSGFKESFYQNFIEKDRWQYLLTGLENTLLITIFAVLIGVAIGFLVAIIRASHDKNGSLKILNFICRVYLTVIRGTPTMIQLMITYYIIFASVNVSKIFVAVCAFGINSGAYVAEIVRSGIMSIDQGQFEAGRSLGFNYEMCIRDSYQIVEEINRRFILEIEKKYPGNQEKVRKMAIVYDGQVKMAHLAIAAGYSVNGVARLHTEILKNQELKDFYEMFPQKFNNKTNGITQRRFLMHGNPLLADWVSNKIGEDWITNLKHLKKLEIYADDKKAQQEFTQIKYQNKLRLAEHIQKHNGVEVDPRSIFDVQVKRLHEYKRQLLNILHVMYLYNQLREHPEMEFYPRTFIFGAKAAAGYKNAKLTIKLINSVADVINNDPSINGKIKVVFIEDYRVSIAEWIFAAADVSEQISTASKEASGTGNMKFMLNGALTLGTMDGANVEIVEEVGEENAFIFGMSSDEVIEHEQKRDYNPMDIFNQDQDIRKVLMELINGFYSPNDPELFRDLYNSLLNTQCTQFADTYFILADFRSYAEAQKRVMEAYKDEEGWAKSAILNVANSGKFSSDRTIQEYVDDIWHLDKVTVDMSVVED